MMRRRQNKALTETIKLAEKFWRYMQDSNQLLGTRTELRRLYKSNFWPALTDPFHKKVSFSSIMWCFRSKHMGVIERKAVGEREVIVYIRGQGDQRQSQRNEGESLGDFAEIKKKIVAPRHRHQMAKDKGGVAIEPEPDREGVVHMNTTSKILQLTVKNQMSTGVILQCAVLGWLGPFQVDDPNNIIRESRKANLRGYRQTCFTVRLTGSQNPGIYSLPVAFVFCRDGSEPFHIVKYIRVTIIDDVVTRLQPTRPYRRRRPFLSHSTSNIERGEPPYAERPDYRVPLGSYQIPLNLRHEIRSEQIQAFFETFEDGENHTPESLCGKFSKLLHVEESQMKLDIQKYQMESEKLVDERPYLTLVVPGLAENRPSLVRGDRLYVWKLAADGTIKEQKKYEGYVHHVTLNKVHLKFSANFHREFIPNSSYQVDFMFSRTTLKLMHRAVGNAAAFFQQIPFDGQPSHQYHIMRFIMPTINCFDSKIDGNEEQKQAVTNILHGTSKPYPYLVFGPPGTGKTVTIVEAIKQVLQHHPNSRVLACAPSNSAADLVLERVAQHNIVPDSQMVRLNAFGRPDTSVKKSVLKFCISDGDGFFRLPSRDDIERKYRLVVTTLITAGRLVSLGIPKSHFTHIFIDEAGQGMEPECLVPIAGLLEIQGNNPGQLVLAGDPKQLGPVLRSPIAIKYGLGISFLERLMESNFRCFNRNPLSEEYDPKTVSKLLNNYRSHPAIIELPNEMFYDNELRPCADVVLRNSLCHWSGLKKKGFPVIFEAVWGKDEREENSPSFFNPQEISVVLRYVTQLKEARGISLNTSEIGVISPYHKQVQKIRQELRKRSLKVTDIKVGSVEEFQGQERKVIIISTVRSNVEFLQFDAEHKLGFLKNPKRFNVAITRAQALLIVIGNPDVLCHDLHWRQFIQYCVEYGSFSGSGGSGSGSLFEMPEEADQSLLETLQRLSLNENTLFEGESDLTGADYEDRPWRSDE